MQDQVIKKIIHTFTIIFITVLIATIVALLILKYNVEGEDNMPFELSTIKVISTAEGIDISDVEPTDSKWNLNIIQNNDIYIEISKNKNYEKTEIIDTVTIDNFTIEKEPNIGTIKIYKPSSEGELTYDNSEENEITDIIEYTGSESSSVKNLEVANQGGLILFRYSIEDLGKYTSDADEIKHDGTILSKIGVNYEDVKCTVSFDISIKLKSETTYTGTITLELPAGNIIQEGTSYYEITDLTNIIFRRNLR